MTTTTEMPCRRPVCACQGCQSKATPADGTAHWQETLGPAPVLAQLHGEPVRHTGGRVVGWADHAYRYRLPDGRWCWVAEPYSLSAGAFADFMALRAAGFEVSVSAEDARHSPGHTIAVKISERTRSGTA